METTNSTHSITNLIPKLHALQPDCPERRAALDALWRRYERQLLAAARHALRQDETLRGDFLEAAMSGFMRFATRAQRGTALFAALTDRDALVKKLVTAARDRAREYRLRQQNALPCQPHAAPEGPPQPERDFDEKDGGLIYEETMASLQQSLPPLVYQAGFLYLHHHTNPEIAAMLCRSTRAVERYLHRFRQAAEQLGDC
jgi:DNA-directed RNA polymerase specialized sigma24 family protein